MTTTSQLSRSFVTSAFNVRRLPAASRTLLATPTSRAELPVLSNRAFVAAWIARRSQLAAAAQLARSS